MICFIGHNPHVKSIVVTGTNGKSTTCKMIEHLLKKNKFNVKLEEILETHFGVLKKNKKRSIYNRGFFFSISLFSSLLN